MEVDARVVTLVFTIDATLESFGSEQQAAMLQLFATELNCVSPGCTLELRITPASLRVEVIATVRNPVGEDSDPVLLDANRMAELSTSELTSLLGWEVQQTIRVTIADARVTMLVLPPVMPPFPFLPVDNAQLDLQTAQDQIAPSLGLDGQAVGITAAIGVGLLLIATGVYMLWRRMDRARAKRRKAEASRYESGVERESKDKDKDAFTITPTGPDDGDKLIDTEGIPLSLELDTEGLSTDIPLADQLFGFELAAAAASIAAMPADPSLTLVAAAAAAASSTDALRKSQSLSLLGAAAPMGSVDEALRMSRSLSRLDRRMVHRAPPARQTTDTLADVLADPRKLEPMQHRPAPTRRREASDAALAELSLNTRQYRPAPQRSVVTPGLPPLGAGAPQPMLDYRAPFKSPEGGGGGESPARTVGGLPPLPENRAMPSRSQSLNDLQSLLPPDEGALPRQSRDDTSLQHRRERRADRRLTTSQSVGRLATAQQFL